MKQKLIDILETFGYPVSLQGTYEEGAELPKSFFTFWNYETEPVFYSNDVKRNVWVFRVFFYSQDPTLTNTILKQACKKLRENNFLVGGAYDIDSGVPNYTAREVEVNIIEKEDEN